MKNKVVVIGSGFGGLGIAIRLQAKGFDVTILEKNAMIGGHAYQLKKKGYTFDMGPSLITAPDIIQELFKIYNKDMNDYLDLVSLDPFYRIYFHDKTYIDYNGDPKNMRKQMSKFNQNDAKNYDKFMNYSRKLYNAVIVDRLGSKPFLNISSFLSFIPKAITLNAILPDFTVVKSYFKDFRNQFLFSFHPLFIGGNPFTAPSLYLMIPYLEREGGIWFSKGGMYSLVRAFEKLFKEAGGKVITNAEVNQIITEGRNAKGVKVGNIFIPADIVISNAHFAHTYMDLISSDARKKWTDTKVKKMKYSMSCVVIYLGVKKKYPKLMHHTLILSERYKGLIDDIFKKKVLPEDFSMYLHVPTRTDSSMAPKNCESMYLLIPVANLAANIDWSKEKDAYIKKILDFLEHDFGLKDLQKNIEVLETFMPEDFRDVRNNYLGAAWSIEPSLFQSANFRPHNKSEDLDNLYLVGASTHPGAGVPGVLLSAETTEKIILNDFKLNA